MTRILVYGLLGLAGAYLLLLNLSAALVDTKREYDRDSPFYRWLLMSATGITVHLLRIRVRVSGAENLPDGRFLLVSNHRSNFDPILTWYVFRKHPMAFISKEENFHIPAFGRIIRRCCFLSIDRQDAKKALITIDKAAKLMAGDVVSMGVYPEGTRSKDGSLLPFHAAVFKIAQRAHTPVVVMTIEGTENIHERTPFRRSEVTVSVLKVFTPEEVCGARSTVLSAQARGLMEENLNETNLGTQYHERKTKTKSASHCRGILGRYHHCRRSES